MGAAGSGLGKRGDCSGRTLHGCCGLGPGEEGGLFGEDAAWVLRARAWGRGGTVRAGRCMGAAGSGLGKRGDCSGRTLHGCCGLGPGEEGGLFGEDAAWVLWARAWGRGGTVRGGRCMGAAGSGLGKRGDCSGRTLHGCCGLGPGGEWGLFGEDAAWVLRARAWGRGGTVRGGCCMGAVESGLGESGDCSGRTLHGCCGLGPGEEGDCSGRTLHGCCGLGPGGEGGLFGEDAAWVLRARAWGRGGTVRGGRCMGAAGSGLGKRGTVRGGRCMGAAGSGLGESGDCSGRMLHGCCGLGPGEEGGLFGEDAAWVLRARAWGRVGTVRGGRCMGAAGSGLGKRGTVRGGRCMGAVGSGLGKRGTVRGGRCMGAVDSGLGERGTVRGGRCMGAVDLGLGERGTVRGGRWVLCARSGPYTRIHAHTDTRTHTYTS